MSHRGIKMKIGSLSKTQQVKFMCDITKSENKELEQIKNKKIISSLL